jgi:hypothetical protein
MFKKLKLMFFYIKQVKKCINDINNYFILNEAKFTYKIKEIKYDKAYRIYTVLNIPEKNAKNLQTYGYYYLDNETKKFLTEMNLLFKKHGLVELIGLTKADQINPTCVHIVMEYKFIKIPKLWRNLILIGLTAIIGTLLLIFI